VINNKKETCAISAETNFKTKTNKPFPLNVGEKSWKNKKKDKSQCLSATDCPKMVKHHPKKNYYVSQEVPDSSTEEDQIETASEDHLRHVLQFGAAFMGPPQPPPTPPKEFFRTCNVLPFSCTHLALWRGKEKGLKLWLAI